MSTPAEGGAGSTATQTHYLRKGTLGVLGIAFFVISAAAPLTGMAGGAPFAMLLGNGVGAPSAYLVITLLLLVFSVGYVAMARHHTSTGAFYSYVARGLGGNAGGAAAWVALLGYNAMQIGLYGLFGAATAGFLSQWVEIPWWVISLTALAIIGVLGYRQVDLSVKVLSILVAAEFAIVLIFDIAVLVKGGGGGGGGLSFESFTPAAFFSGAPAIGLLFAAASFIGFEATTIYSEEAKDPARTVPKATYVAVLTIGIFYTLTSWLMVNAYGQPDLQEFIGGLSAGPDAPPDPTIFLFAMAEGYIGSFLTNQVMALLFATSVFAALLAFHNAVARYLYALGREGLAPDTLGRTHPIHLSPHAGSISQSGLAAAVVLLFVVTGRDPVTQLFTWLSQLGTLAILFLMAAAGFAVLAFFSKNRHLDANPWRTTGAPIIGAVGLLAVAIYSFLQFGDLIGDPASPLRWLLPALIPVVALVGVFAAGRLRSTNPARYAEMGRHRGDD